MLLSKTIELYSTYFKYIMELKLTEEIWFSLNTLEPLRRNRKPGKQVNLKKKKNSPSGLD